MTKALRLLLCIALLIGCVRPRPSATDAGTDASPHRFGSAGPASLPIQFLVPPDGSNQVIVCASDGGCVYQGQSPQAANIIFRPGGVSSGNICATSACVSAALAAAPGASVYVDTSLGAATLASTTWNFNGAGTLVSYSGNYATLTLTGTAQLLNLPFVSNLNLVFSSTTTPGIQFSTWTGAVIPQIEFNATTIGLSSGASASPVQVPASGSLYMGMANQSIFIAGANTTPFISLGASAVASLSVLQSEKLPATAVSGGGTTALSWTVDLSVWPVTTQTGFSGALSTIQIDAVPYAIDGGGLQPVVATAGGAIPAAGSFPMGLDKCDSGETPVEGDGGGDRYRCQLVNGITSLTTDVTATGPGTAVATVKQAQGGGSNGLVFSSVGNIACGVTSSGCGMTQSGGSGASAVGNTLTIAGQLESGAGGTGGNAIVTAGAATGTTGSTQGGIAELNGGAATATSGTGLGGNVQCTPGGGATDGGNFQVNLYGSGTHYTNGGFNSAVFSENLYTIAAFSGFAAWPSTLGTEWLGSGAFTPSSTNYAFQAASTTQLTINAPTGAGTIALGGGATPWGTFSGTSSAMTLQEAATTGALTIQSGPGLGGASSSANAGNLFLTGSSALTATSGTAAGGIGGSVEMASGAGANGLGGTSNGGGAGLATIEAGGGGNAISTGTGGTGGGVAIYGGYGGNAAGAGIGGAGGSLQLQPGLGGTTSGGTSGVDGNVSIILGSPSTGFYTTHDVVQFSDGDGVFATLSGYEHSGGPFGTFWLQQGGTAATSSNFSFEAGGSYLQINAPTTSAFVGFSQQNGTLDARIDSSGLEVGSAVASFGGGVGVIDVVTTTAPTAAPGSGHELITGLGPLSGTNTGLFAVGSDGYVTEMAVPVTGTHNSQLNYKLGNICNARLSGISQTATCVGIHPLSSGVVVNAKCMARTITAGTAGAIGDSSIASWPTPGICSTLAAGTTTCTAAPSTVVTVTGTSNIVSCVLGSASNIPTVTLNGASNGAGLVIDTTIVLELTYF